MGHYLFLLLLVVAISKVVCFGIFPTYVGVDRPLIVFTPTDDTRDREFTDGVIYKALQHSNTSYATSFNTNHDRRSVYVGKFDLDQVKNRFDTFTCIVEIHAPYERMVGCMVNLVGEDEKEWGAFAQPFRNAERKCLTQQRRLDLDSLSSLMEICTPYIPSLPRSNDILFGQFPQIFWQHSQFASLTSTRDGSQSTCLYCREIIGQRSSQWTNDESNFWNAERKNYWNLIKTVNSTHTNADLIGNLARSIQYCKNFDEIFEFRDKQLICWYKWMFTQKCIIAEVSKTPAFNIPAEGGLLFIHVGKSCGGTITQTLRANHLRNRQVHGRAALAVEVLAASRIIITIRNPVERIVSMMQEVVESNLNRNHTSEECMFGIQSLHDYTELLMGNSTCSGFWNRGIRHAYFDTCSYMGGVIDVIQQRRNDIRIVEKESCTDDLVGALHWLGRLDINTTNLVTNHIHSEKKKLNEALTEDEIRKVQNFVDATGEFDLYRKIRELKGTKSN